MTIKKTLQELHGYVPKTNCSFTSFEQQFSDDVDKQMTFLRALLLRDLGNIDLTNCEIIPGDNVTFCDLIAFGTELAAPIIILFDRYAKLESPEMMVIHLKKDTKYYSHQSFLERIVADIPTFSYYTGYPRFNQRYKTVSFSIHTKKFAVKCNFKMEGLDSANPHVTFSIYRLEQFGENTCSDLILGSLRRMTWDYANWHK